MASLETIATKIDNLQGDYSDYKRILTKELNYLTDGRRAGYNFVVRSNIRTLRSGPNRGKLRVDGAVVVMIDNKNPARTSARIVRKGKNLLRTLDSLASTFQNESTRETPADENARRLMKNSNEGILNVYPLVE